MFSNLNYYKKTETEKTAYLLSLSISSYLIILFANPTYVAVQTTTYNKHQSFMKIIMILCSLICRKLDLYWLIRSVTSWFDQGLALKTTTVNIKTIKSSWMKISLLWEIRSSLRRVMRRKKITDCWSSYGKIVVKDLQNKITEIKSSKDLTRL